jgi:hypothetical protein
MDETLDAYLSQERAAPVLHPARYWFGWGIVTGVVLASVGFALMWLGETRREQSAQRAEAACAPGVQVAPFGNGRFLTPDGYVASVDGGHVWQPLDAAGVRIGISLNHGPWRAAAEFRPKQEAK